MHISLQLQSEKQKLIKSQNKALILGIWVFKLYMVAFAAVCAFTIKSETPKVLASNSTYVLRK